MPQPTELLIPSSQHCLARALYDNVPDTPDELEFQKGDNLVVLEQNISNIEGWWLCSLRGRQGICPANRLRLIPGVFDHQSGTSSRMVSPQFFDHHSHHDRELNYLQKQGKRRSWQLHPNQVITPKKFNDVFLYDMPPSSSSSSSPSSIIRCSPILSSSGGENLLLLNTTNDCYDVPPRAVPVGNENFRNCPRCSPNPPPTSCISPISRESVEAYDVPRSLLLSSASLNNAPLLTPSSSASSLTADSHSSLSSSNRSSFASSAANNMPDYDVPRPHNRQLFVTHNSLNSSSSIISSTSSTTYDVPVSQPPQQLKELPLELSSALENLERLETDTLSATSRLLGFVQPNWRTRDKLDATRMEMKLSVIRLRTSLHDLAEFGEGALGNAAKASDKNLIHKLAPLVAALRKSDNLVQAASMDLDRHNWQQIENNNNNNNNINKIHHHKPDELEQLVACARALTDDVRQIASFIQGNATLLFKKESSLSNLLLRSDEEYDYVSLDSKENVRKENREILNQLPTKELKKCYDNCVKNASDDDHHHSVILLNDNGCYTLKNLPHDDKQLLIFFAAQIVSHHTNLTQAIDAFLQTVEHNQPPKIFLAHGKFVVLSAHKLVHIGDTVHRNISCKEIKLRSLNYANALSDALANCVNKTKQAALQFPLVSAVQEMVDSIVDISHFAKDLKVCLVQAAQPFL